MSGVLFFQDRAEQICAGLGIGPAAARPVGLGLCYADADVDPDALRATPGAGVDLAMSVLVEGQPMDVHGQGVPVPTRMGLRHRLDNWRASVPDGPVGTGEGVLIGVVDSGIVPNPWLTGGFLAAPDDFESQIASRHHQPDDTSPNAPVEIGHGTFAAGLILQQAPAAGVWVERALGPDGTADASTVIEKAQTLARRGVDVLNLSLGAFADDPAAHDVMARMVGELQRINPKMVIVAAAGNLPRTAPGADEFRAPGPFWPAALPWGVVAVGAADATRTAWAPWSNRGPWIDLAAPGTDLVSTYIDGCLRPPRGGWTAYHGWARWSGTSFATAVVSGAIAALMTGPDGPISAEEAVYALRTGTWSSGWIEADGIAPRVPVVTLRPWPARRARP